jgi:molybdopterin molybdotransferase
MTKPTVDAALDTIRQAMSVIEAETVPVRDALGRVTAADVLALRNVPGFRAAAMDGYAVRAQDLAAGALPLDRATIAAGDWPEPLPPGHAAGIATGAPVPAGADRILPVERATLSDQHIVPQSMTPDANPNIREIGEDAAAGTRIVAAGTVVSPDAIGLMAACGVTAIAVRRRPVIGLLSTGNELLPGAGTAGIVDSNAPMIAACATEIGLPVHAMASVGDDERSILAAIAATPADVVISTGGVSAGSRDLIRGALVDYGARIVFHGVAMRPGKPILFAILPDGRPFFGLPGNPVAAFVGFRFFVSAAIRAMLGLPVEAGATVPGDQPGRAGTTLFLRGRRQRTEDGRLTVDTSLDQRSHILSAVVTADCWLRIDLTGETVERKLFRKNLRLT